MLSPCRPPPRWTALLALISFSALRAGAQAAGGPTASDFYLSSFAAPAIPASSALAAAPIAAPAANSLSYRLDLWSGLFTSGENALLHSSSQLLSFARAVRRIESLGPVMRDRQEAAGSALSSEIAVSLVYYGGLETDPFLDAVSFGQPGASLHRALERQLVPMAADLAQRGRARGELDGTSLFLARSIALLAPLRGSAEHRAEASGLQLATVSLLSGDWPDFQNMGPADYVRFGQVWLRRTASALAATELGRLMTPRQIPLAGRAIVLRRAPLPVALFSVAY
jgi:hypothetical protein